MPKSGPIVVIEDDLDDQEIVTMIVTEIGIKNEMVFFSNAQGAFQFLKSTLEQPFIILCAINLPGMDGLELKRQVDEDHELRQKCVPFIFFSTAATKDVVTEAFTEMNIQGFFEKSNKLEELRSSLKTILDYWKLCRHPNSDSYMIFSKFLRSLTYSLGFPSKKIKTS
jgi:CheY-like chemotaxis protein